MLQRFRKWRETNQVILSNAASLAGTTIVTSGLGFAYWWLAAQFFSQTAVGLASAAIAAMMLIGTIGMFGLGTLLIGELSRQPARRGALITASLTVVAVVSLVLALLFVLVGPVISTELHPFTRSAPGIGLLVSGVMLTAVTLVLDQILIGLLRGDWQLFRNTTFSFFKLVALVAAGVGVGSMNGDAAWLGIVVFATWVGGIVVSLVLLGAVVAIKGTPLLYRPQFGLLRQLRYSMLSHHGLNLTLQIPSFTMPVLVTALLSAELNASFYVAWMIAGLLSVFPTHLTMVLYAVGSKDPAVLAQKTRMTLQLSYAMGGAACIFLWVGSPFILSFFGEAYAAQADWCLRLLGVGIFGLIIKDHYVAICRVYNRITMAIGVLFVTGMIEIVCAAVGALRGGLVGLAIGWVIAVAIQALVMLPWVIQTVLLDHSSKEFALTEPDSSTSSS